MRGCKCKKAQRDNGQCLPDYATSPNHAYLKKTLGPSVIYSMPTGRPVRTSEGPTHVLSYFHGASSDATQSARLLHVITHTFVGLKCLTETKIQILRDHVSHTRLHTVEMGCQMVQLLSAHIVGLTMCVNLTLAYSLFSIYVRSHVTFASAILMEYQICSIHNSQCSFLSVFYCNVVVVSRIIAFNFDY